MPLEFGIIYGNNPLTFQLQSSRLLHFAFVSLQSIAKLDI